jgi:hypothetical protein
MTFTDPAEDQTVIAARDAEYAEVLGRLPELRRELADEQARGNVTYAQVEDSEADLQQFRSRMNKIAARDYFAAPAGQDARDAVEQVALVKGSFPDARRPCRDVQGSRPGMIN